MELTGVGSQHHLTGWLHEAGWVNIVWEGLNLDRNLQRQQQRYDNYLNGVPSLQVVGCSTKPLLRLEMTQVMQCILHLSMAIGHILAEWMQTKDRCLPPRPSRPVCRKCFLNTKRAST